MAVAVATAFYLFRVSYQFYYPIMTHKINRAVALVLIIGGLAGLLPLGYYALRSKIAFAQNIPTSPSRALALKSSATLVSGQPIEITIPSLNIDLAVIPGVYDANTDQWNLTLDKAQFANPSTLPNNETGNTLIYGHYRPEVFAYLHHIKPAATATVTTANGYKFSYVFQNSVAVDPRDTSIFNYRGAPRLTIQTCSGAFMQNRQMYYFQYTGYLKS